jgi:hypothetical protein
MNELPQCGRDAVSKRTSTVSRRGLLKAASLVGATAVGSPVDVTAQVPAQPGPAGATMPPPNPAAERGDHPEIGVIQGHSGSDYMADVIKSLGIEHVASNPGNLFRALFAPKNTPKEVIAKINAAVIIALADTTVQARFADLGTNRRHPLRRRDTGQLLQHEDSPMKPTTASSTQEALAGLVESVTFHNAENGFCVLRTNARGHWELVRGGQVVEAVISQRHGLCGLHRSGPNRRSM